MYNVKRYMTFRIMYLGYCVLGTGIPFLWQERFPSDVNLLSFDTKQICGITTMFWMNVLPLCSGLQNYFQGMCVLICMSKIAVMWTSASSTSKADSDSFWLQCIQALYEG